MSGDSTGSASLGAAYPSTRRALAAGVWGKAAEVATLVALVTVVPRVLGPSDYGSFAVALALVTLGSTALALSGPVVMARFVGAAAPAERAALARALALRALRWRAAGLAAAAVVGAGLVAFDRDRFAPLPTAIVVLAVTIDAPATVAFQVALALGRTVAWSFRYPLQNLVLVVTAPLLHAVAGVDGALTAVAIASAASLLLGLALVAAPLRAAPVRTRVPRDVSRFAALQGWGNVLVQVQHRGVVVAAALLAGARAETGYAALAAGVAVALTYAVWQLFTVTMPRFAATATADPEVAVAGLRRVAHGAVVVAAVLGLLGAVVVGPLLPLVFGHDFEPAETAFAPALATIPLAPLTGAVGGAGALQLRLEARLATTAAGALVFAVTARALVLPAGAAGATGALLAGTAASAIAGATFFRGLLDVRFLALALAASAATLGLGLALG